MYPAPIFPEVTLGYRNHERKIPLKQLSLASSSPIPASQNVVPAKNLCSKIHGGGRRRPALSFPCCSKSETGSRKKKIKSGSSKKSKNTTTYRSHRRRRPPLSSSVEA